MAFMFPRHRSHKAEVDDLTERIRRFRPTSSFVHHNNESDILIIGLFGNTGVGKSSLINSLLSLVSRDKYHVKAHVSPLDAAKGKRSGSIMRNDFELTPFIRLVDNRGLEGKTTAEVQREIQAQLEGRRGYATEVDYEGRAQDDIVGDAVHVAILVVDGNQDNQEVECWRNFVNTVHRWRGRPPLAVITHADLAKEGNLRSTTGHLHSIGVGEHSVYRVANLSQSTGKIKSAYKLTLLKMLVMCTVEASPIAKHRSRRHFEQSQKQRTPKPNRKQDAREKAEKEEQYDRADNNMDVADNRDAEEHVNIDKTVEMVLQH